MGLTVLPYGLRQRLMLELQRSYITLTLPPIVEMPLTFWETMVYERDLEQISIDRPIFIIGCHRSGTTALYDLLAHHPDVAYFTNASALLPKASILSHVLGQMMGLDDIVQERFFEDGVGYAYDSPSEGIRVWELYTADRATHCLDETHGDEQMESYLKRMIRKHLKFQGRTRFLNKNPDHSVRTRYLHNLFPDARFLHIVRDARAVVASLIRAKQRCIEFFGPDHPHSQHGTMVEDWSQIKHIWEQEDAVVGAGMLWKAVVETVRRDAQVLPADQFLEIHYEDLVQAPQDYVARILDFCQLRQDEEVERALHADLDAMKGRGRKQSKDWKTRFSDSELERLMAVVGPTMRTFAYSS